MTRMDFGEIEAAKYQDRRDDIRKDVPKQHSGFGRADAVRGLEVKRSRTPITAARIRRASFAQEAPTRAKMSAERPVPKMPRIATVINSPGSDNRTSRIAINKRSMIPPR